MTRAKWLYWINIVALVISVIVWIAAGFFHWLDSVKFVSHVSMAALILSSLSGIAAGDAAVEAEKTDSSS